MTGRRWIDADAWLQALGEQEPMPRRHLDYQTLIEGTPPAHRESPVRFRWPQAGQDHDAWPGLLERIDRLMVELRKQPRRQHATRRLALLEDRDLAGEVYRIVQERGVADTLRMLDISRQSLHDVWIARGWPAPLGSGNKPRSSAA